ncbi:MAG: hypothetical protein DME26_05145 [Verrucomicrobia bacterium]|nr:MAG: hypothetical protein DME26_05145 [Verrucomicrobiota bacterium]
MKISNRQQALAIFAGIALALLLGDRFILSPLTHSWKERTSRIADLTKNINRGKALLDREQIVRSRWESMKKNTFPTAESAAENEMLKAFDRWSQNSRISISSIKPQWKRINDEYRTLECRADASGSMQELTRFLYEVERDPLALRVESVEITTRDNNGQQLSLGLQVSALVLNSQQP